MKQIAIALRNALPVMVFSLLLLTSCNDDNPFLTTGDMSALAFGVTADHASPPPADQRASRSTTHVVDAIELEGDTLYLTCTVTDIDAPADVSATRATPISTSNLSSKYGRFNVSAYVGGDLSTPLQQTDEEGNVLSSPESFIDIPFVFSQTYTGVTPSAELWKANATDFYWPKDQTVPLTFYAYAPTSDYTGTDAWAGLTPSTDFKAGGVIEFDYTVPANKTNSSSQRVDAEYQPDILVASIPSIKRTDSSITNVGRNPDDFCIVPMTFYHALSAIDFKVSAGLKRDITLNSLTLSGLKAEGTCTYTPPTTSGKHSADVVSWTHGTGTTGTYCQTYNYAVPTTAPATDPALGTASQTFMLIPQAIGPGGDATAATITIAYDGSKTKTVALHSSAKMTWEPGKRYSYTLTGDLEKFVFSLVHTSDASLTIADPSTAPMKTVEVTSTKNDEAHSWVIKTVDGTSVDGTTYTISDRLKIEKDGGNLKVTDLRPRVSLGDHDHWTDETADWYSQSWGSESGGANKGPIDLSRYNFEADSYSASSAMHTANCYIVRHAGTYRIPLVYGNASDGESTYKPSITGTNVLTQFVSHTGGKIFSPFIENNRKDGSTSTSFSNTNRNKPTTAGVVWQEVPGVITVNASTAVHGHTAGSSQCTASNCGYVEFTISQDDICQNNGVIAVYDSSGDVLWSWHIWVTNDPTLSNGPIAASNGTQSYSFFPLPCIGWMEPANLYDEEEDDVTIVLEQADSKNTMTVTVKQPEKKLSVASNGVWYQWGRKDPMRGIVGNGYDLATGPAASLADGIKNPGSFYIISGSGDWCSTTYYNLWTGKYSGLGVCDQQTGMIKTIYDPSPVGYKVPAPNAFLCTGITITGTSYCDRKTGVKGSGGTYYWSSVTDNSDTKRGSSYKSSGQTANNKSEGFAVRPVKE